MAKPHSNSRPDLMTAWDPWLWPADRLGEAIHALARSAGLPTTCRETFAPPADLTTDQLSTWMEAAADRGGMQANQIIASLDDLNALAVSGGPLLLRVEDGRFLAVAGSRRRRVSVLAPDLCLHTLPAKSFNDGLRKPFEAPFEEDVDLLLERMRVPARRRARARNALLSERLRAVRLRSCWLLRLPPGSPVKEEIAELRLKRDVILLFSTHVAQYVVFVASWWLIGRGLLQGTIDTGWFAGWVLLLLSLVPLRLLATWTQGLVSTTAGAALRRRLLRGALRIDREDIRRKGAGQLFGVVVESAAIESLALSGGVTAALALVELVVAGAVLWSGAGILPAVILLLWVTGTTVAGWRYIGRRRRWTAERLALTGQLMESMVGHRTRLAQQPMAAWHPQEDIALARYIEAGHTMDRSGVWLTAFVPRGWLTLALAALAPLVVAHAPPQRIAIAVGGALLAYRSLRRLSGGLSHLAGAVIAGQAIAPLARAAGVREAAPHPSMVIPSHLYTDTTDDAIAIQARDLAFTYPQQADPVLAHCSLVVPRGARILLEGASGAGKTTLASILAGLDTPDSGLLLLDGLDRSVLGRAGWRQRAVMAPQAHDNYLVTGSLAFNLLMGRRWPAQRADLAEAETVCRELGLGELLDRLPAGLHQMVGETGWQLSQGERTRVFLARALLQNPELLVLDESFSALDPENVDRSIRCVLRRATTVLAVAHV